MTEKQFNFITEKIHKLLQKLSKKFNVGIELKAELLDTLDTHKYKIGNQKLMHIDIDINKY